MGDPERERLALAVLAAAGDHVELGAFGAAAMVTDACHAYWALGEALATAPGAVERLEPELVRMIREGAPAAIIYAALLLRRAGRDVAPLVAPYADDRRPCAVAEGGCMVMGLWLGEAARWAASGERWSHPDRAGSGRDDEPARWPWNQPERVEERLRAAQAYRLALDLDHLERARWFELPSAALLEAARALEATPSFTSWPHHSLVNIRAQPRHRRLSAGDWVFAVGQLLVAPAQLAPGRARLDRMLAHPEPAVRLYAALLIRALDPAAGARALAAIAAAGGHVKRLSPTWLRRKRTREVPIGEVVGELAGWPPARAG